MAAIPGLLPCGASTISTLPVSQSHLSHRIPGHVERVGILGGTFDPIHLGHLIQAQAALEELNLDRIVFLPAAISPYKQDRPPAALHQDRMEMIRLAIDDEPRFSADDRELDRIGPSYTIDTVRSLLGDYPGVRFFYLIGADQLKDLRGWHEFHDLEKLIDFVVFDRSSNGHVVITDYPMVHRRIDISSTEIRERLAKGLAVRYFLPSTVHDYIMTHSLYLSPRSDA